MSTGDLIDQVRVSNTLGEGVLWNTRTQSIWWTDIQQARLFEYTPSDRTLKSWETPHRVACFGFIEDDDRLVVAFDCGIAIYSVRSGTVNWLVPPGVLNEGVRFNDGKVDASGRFWVGSMVEDLSLPLGKASLYCYSPGQGLVEVVKGLSISNGLCWSPDATVMYLADSPRRLIQAFRFEQAQGTPTAPTHFARTPPDIFPDGSAVDIGGGIWNAQWGGARVVRYGKDGETEVVIAMPVSQPSCVAFGGGELDLLIVTSARDGLNEKVLASEPGAGDLFIFRSEFTGQPEPRFRLN